jgi:hypothetical protein
MSTQNPHVESPHEPSGDDAIQPHAPDFIEMPEVPPLSMEKEPMPVWLYLVCGVLLFLAGSSFTGFQIFGTDLLDQGPGGPAMASGSGEAEAPATPLELGKKIYGNNCASCHDSTGAVRGEIRLGRSAWMRSTRPPRNLPRRPHPGTRRGCSPSRLTGPIRRIRSRWAAFFRPL